MTGAVQTQILGISAGKMVRDMNCEKLKNAKVLYDMGMKVAAVSVMCQDERVFDAMMNAGTPCPFDGKIGAEAKAAWLANEELQPDADSGSLNPLQDLDEDEKSTLLGGAYCWGSPPPLAYSDTTYGTTSNGAINGLSWGMGTILT